MSLDLPARSVRPSADAHDVEPDIYNGQDIVEFAEFVPTRTEPNQPALGDSASPRQVSPEPDGVPPAWFKKLGKSVNDQDEGETKNKRTKPPKRKRSNRGPKIDVAPEDERHVTWKEKTVLWVLSVAAGSYGLSLLFHIVILGCASLILLQQFDDNQAVSTIITESQGADMEFEQIFDTRIDAGLNDSEDTQLPKYQPLTVTDPSTLMVSPAEILGSVSGDGDSEDNGGGNFVFKMPTGGKVVTKGSFTAWTVPKDPKPREEYQIIIQITLPKKLRRYRSSDLSGKVIGTDGYTQGIPYDRRKPSAAKTTRKGRLVVVKQRAYLPLKDRVAQLAITIPGAGMLVKDTIVIESRILKEKQTLVIEF